MNTRFFLPEFGSRLNELLEEQNTDVLDAIVKDFIINSLDRWEKRINLLEAEILRPSDTQINIRLQYEIINTQLQDTFIFPFYEKITN